MCEITAHFISLHIFKNVYYVFYKYAFLYRYSFVNSIWIIVYKNLNIQNISNLKPHIFFNKDKQALLDDIMALSMPF